MIRIGQSVATIDTPLEHLLACHRRIEDRLQTLVRSADELARNRDQALDAIRNSVRFLDSSGVLHTEDEEKSVFPRIRPALGEHELALVDSLEKQHRETDALLTELRNIVAQLAASSSPETLERYREVASTLAAIYREHIRFEDDILTPWARRSLDQAQLEAISAEMRQRRAQRRGQESAK